MSRPFCKLAHVCYNPNIMAKKKKNPHAVALAKLGSKKGGKARWKGVSQQERSKILRRAALARWRKKK